MPTFFSEFEKDELAEGILEECLSCGWLDARGRCPLRTCRICQREA